MKKLRIFLMVLIGGSASAMGGFANADTEYDRTATGYTGYDYDTHEWTDVTEQPDGSYETYNYETHEYTDIEPSPGGGFTVYSDDE